MSSQALKCNHTVFDSRTAGIISEKEVTQHFTRRIMNITEQYDACLNDSGFAERISVWKPCG